MTILLITIFFGIAFYLIFKPRRGTKSHTSRNNEIAESDYLSTNQAAYNDNFESLLKRATEQKKAGDINSAIDTLKLARNELTKNNASYSIQTFLRLPLYLQKAGRNDEAWSEFNALLSNGYPNCIFDNEVWPAEQGIIYDKMRLFLQREGKHDLAISFGILSHLMWSKALFNQKRQKELIIHQSKNEIIKMLSPLLTKAKKEQSLEKIRELLQNLPLDPNQINILEVREQIHIILDNQDKFH